MAHLQHNSPHSAIAKTALGRSRLGQAHSLVAAGYAAEQLAPKRERTRSFALYTKLH